MPCLVPAHCLLFTNILSLSDTSHCAQPPTRYCQRAGTTFELLGFLKHSLVLSAVVYARS